jgi:hypothetical protein
LRRSSQLAQLLTFGETMGTDKDLQSFRHHRALVHVDSTQVIVDDEGHIRISSA